MQAATIDTFAFCQAQEVREGRIAVAAFSRLASECVHTNAELKWSLKGGFNHLGQPKLELAVSSRIELMCQRCLTPFEFDINSQSELILAKNEEQADEIEAMLEDDEVDVVVGSKAFNIMDLIEDEALLAIPQSPKHAVCPDVALASSSQSVAANKVNAGDAASTSTKVSPFAVLKKLQ